MRIERMSKYSSGTYVIVCTLLWHAWVNFALASTLPHAAADTCGRSGFSCSRGNNAQQCVDGRPQGTLQPCGPGLTCDADNGDLSPCVPSPPPCSHEGLLPVAGNCRLFSLCISSGVHFIQFDAACAPGFEFSARQLRCVEKNLAGCSVIEPSTSIPVASTTLTPVPTTTTSVKTTPTIIPTTSKPKSTTTTTTTKAPVTLSPFRCPSLGMHADPNSCSHYYHCSWGQGNTYRATRSRCAQTLVFDVTLRQCIYRTNCGKRPLNG